jgi:PIN domain nuclease of toxin-antitoxin system
VTALLLDTHVAFWWLMRAPLSEASATAISARRNRAFVSLASVWEVAIKVATGNLRPPEDFARAVQDEGFELLPITVEHARATGALPLHHRDLFDRMLVAQAQVERLTLVTRDARLSQYDVKVLTA